MVRFDDAAVLRQDWISMVYDSFDLVKGLPAQSVRKTYSLLCMLVRNLAEACVRGRYLSIPITACRASRAVRARVIDALHIMGVIDDVKIGYSYPTVDTVYKEFTKLYPSVKVFDAIDNRALSVSEKWSVVNRVDGADVPIKARKSEHQFLVSFAKHTQRRCNIPIHHFRRVFNGGEQFGGRVYSPFQQMPKATREHILIDGEPTIEVDYSASQIKLAFALIGAPLTEDPYVGYEVERDVAKKAINIMMNARRPLQVFRDSRYSALFGWDAERAKCFMACVYARYPDFKRLIGVDIGKRLQRLEGDITGLLMREFKTMGEVILPIHDSYIVRRDLKPVLVDAMSTMRENVVSVERCNFNNERPL